MKHKGTIKIETDRLILRKFVASDTEAAFQNWMSDNRVTEFLRWLHIKILVKQSKS